MITLNGKGKISPHIRKSALEKWNKGLEALESGLVPWWIASGSQKCSFCRTFVSPEGGCDSCPLHTGEVCAKPWNAIATIIAARTTTPITPADIAKIHDYILDMIEMIKAVPVEREGEEDA